MICNLPAGNLQVRSCDLLPLDSSTAVVGDWFRNRLAGAGEGEGWCCKIRIHNGWLFLYNTAVVNAHVEHTNPGFLLFKMDIVNYLFIAFNFLLALCNIPQRFLNYISFPANFSVLFYFTKSRGIFHSPPGLMYSFCVQFNHFVVLHLR